MQNPQTDRPRAAADIIISAFPDKTGKAADITLQYFMQTITGQRPNRAAADIMRLRSIDKAIDREAYNRIKTHLPCVTLSCRCTPGESHAAHGEFNGIVCVDIDASDNLQIPADLWAEVRTALGRLPYVYLSALSAGGRGVFVICAVDPTTPLGVAFEGLQRAFADTFGITIDKSCGNVNRLRFLSYDPGAVVNTPTTHFKAILSDIRPRDSKTYHRNAKCRNNAVSVRLGEVDKYDRVRAAVQLWHRRGIALEDYGDWVKAAAALQEVPDGSELFDIISRNSRKYNAELCRAKFDDCKNLARVGVGSLFWLCEQYGLSEEEITAELRAMQSSAESSAPKQARVAVQIQTQTAEPLASQDPGTNPLTAEDVAPMRRALHDIAPLIGSIESVSEQVKRQDAELWRAVFDPDTPPPSECPF